MRGSTERACRVAYIGRRSRSRRRTPRGEACQAVRAMGGCCLIMVSVASQKCSLRRRANQQFSHRPAHNAATASASSMAATAPAATVVPCIETTRRDGRTCARLHEPRPQRLGPGLFNVRQRLTIAAAIFQTVRSHQRLLQRGLGRAAWKSGTTRIERICVYCRTRRTCHSRCDHRQHRSTAAARGLFNTRISQRRRRRVRSFTRRIAPDGRAVLVARRLGSRRHVRMLWRGAMTGADQTLLWSESFARLSRSLVLDACITRRCSS